MTKPTTKPTKQPVRKFRVYLPQNVVNDLNTLLNSVEFSNLRADTIKGLLQMFYDQIGKVFVKIGLNANEYINNFPRLNAQQARYNGKYDLNYLPQMSADDDDTSINIRLYPKHYDALIDVFKTPEILMQMGQWYLLNVIYYNQDENDFGTSSILEYDGKNWEFDFSLNAAYTNPYGDDNDVFDKSMVNQSTMDVLMQPLGQQVPVGGPNNVVLLMDDAKYTYTKFYDNQSMFDRIKDIRDHLNGLTPQVLNKDELTAFDYLNVAQAHIVGHMMQRNAKGEVSGDSRLLTQFLLDILYQEQTHETYGFGTGDFLRANFYHYTTKPILNYRFLKLKSQVVYECNSTFSGDVSIKEKDASDMLDTLLNIFDYKLVKVFANFIVNSKDHNSYSMFADAIDVDYWSNK